jgi:hypothetical protein
VLHQPELRRAGLAILAAVVVHAGLQAQDDLRDVVTLKNGEVVRCRVYARYATDTVTLQFGRRRKEPAARGRRGDPAAIRKVLEALGLSAEVPVLAAARSPPRQDQMEFG